jgi:hypothetical protein
MTVSDDDPGFDAAGSTEDRMTVSRKEALEALRDIEAVRNRSSALRQYALVAPHFFLWGIIWAVGYGIADFMPARASTAWSVLLPLGGVAGFVITRRMRGRSGGKQFAAAAVTILLFLLATFAIMSPLSSRQIAAFVPLVMATGYALVGIWFGLRFVVAGAVIAAATLIGFFFLSHHFSIWMAGVGGGSLILAGIWFRRA